MLTDVQEKPSDLLARLLREHQEPDPRAILAWLEQRAKQRGDLETLRAVRDFRRDHLPNWNPNKPAK